MSNKKVELLLPAGNINTLNAAVENGADAVYFGVGKFNARRRATNFNFENLNEVVNYCHQNGVKIYCTMNILVKNHEVKDFFKDIKKIYLANVDAVIIQELSFLPIIKQNFPGLEVHISTQAAVSNTYFNDLIKLADKVVLPREYSKEEIQKFIEKTNLPTEIFVQGALCFSYSGRCLFSSFLGGRSGNRGLCAQPCRKKYNGKYLLSMKDLCLVEKIHEMIEIGISAFKIEGRLRSVKYVTAATKLYRKVIDDYYAGKLNNNSGLEKFDLELYKELELAFNREYTEGYYVNDKELVSSDRPMGRGIFLGVMFGNNKIELQDDLIIGDGLGIWFKNRVDGALLKKMDKDGESINEAKKGEIVKLFIRAPTGTKIYKTSTQKEVTKIEFVRNEPIIVKERKVNELELPNIEVSGGKNETELLVKVYSLPDLMKSVSAGADKTFYNIFAKDFSNNMDAYVPRILSDNDVEKVLNLIELKTIKNILIGDLGAYLAINKKFGDKVKIYLDYNVNIFNDIDLQHYENSEKIISPELNFNELSNFKNKDFTVLVHGNVILMNTKYPNLPKNLRDEKKFDFPVRKEHDYYQVLNARELGLYSKILKLKNIGVNKFFLDLDSKLNCDIKKIVKTYHSILNGKEVSYTTKRITKGHWSLGVE
ncbi:U32 family peptidase [archaeon]|nr:U32 family peptidase [archaeon]MBT3451593.1 U32 family peptidase [archaeon]MBT6869613.1 U32 family peptidase [archaeon]MBT7192382.1 U32 family peptidase [archaeon]MBT7380183.1 U32 family peptidase [archaeon]